MGLVVPKVRTHLCADALLRLVQDVFCQLPEHRKGGSRSFGTKNNDPLEVFVFIGLFDLLP